MEYKVVWEIRNYSYCLEKNGEALYSPEFFIHGLKKTAWRLGLHPRGRNFENEGYISLFLKRSKIDGGPENILLRCELSLLAKDISEIISKEFQYKFQKGHGYGCARYIHMCEFLMDLNRDNFLPRNTLGVQCKILFGDGDIYKEVTCFARTMIAKEYVSFLHISPFSRMTKPSSYRCYRLRFSEEDGYLRFKIKQDDITDWYGKLAVEIASTCTKRILLACNIFLVGANGSKTKCGGEDNRYHESRKEISRLVLTLTKRKILDRKEEFCPNDELTLLYKCYFSTGVKYENIENTMEYRRLP